MTVSMNRLPFLFLLSITCVAAQTETGKRTDPADGVDPCADAVLPGRLAKKNAFVARRFEAGDRVFARELKVAAAAEGVLTKPDTSRARVPGENGNSPHRPILAPACESGNPTVVTDRIGGAAAVTLSAKTVSIEDSPLFEKRADPQSGVVSYILKPGRFAFSQQSLYFVSISMTDDARFILFSAQGPEGEIVGPPDETGRAKVKKADDRKTLMVVDVARGTAYPVLPEEAGRKVGTWLDVKTGDLYWLDFEAFYKLNLADPAGTNRKLFDLPENFRALGPINSTCMHLTLSPDCRTAFLDTKIREPRKWVQGALDIPTGTYVKWSETWYELAHGQINPADSALGLVALQPAGDKTKAKEMPPDAEYCVHGAGCRNPGNRCYRMHVVAPGKPVDHILTPEGVHATHEIWSKDGRWIYWCDNSLGPLGGVWRQSLATRRSERVVPFKAQHAMPSADNRYVVYDRNTGDWRGGPWRVEFCDTVTGRRTMIRSGMPALRPREAPSNRHPDPHPQFVAHDRYVVYTFNNADGHMDLAVTPVAQLVTAWSR